MTWVWNGNLHGWRVNRSIIQCQKQFLYLDHWIEIPKSRDTMNTSDLLSDLGLDHLHIPNDLIDLPWRTIVTSHSTTRKCAPLDSQSGNNSTFHLWRSMHKMHTPMYQRACITYFCLSAWISQVPFGCLHAHAFGYLYMNPETMNLAPFSDNVHFTCITKFTSWMLHIIGFMHENIQYGMLQLHHYNFGLQTSNHTSSAVP